MKKILIIEDDTDVRSNLEDLLNANNYSVTCTSDGCEALENVKTEMPDLVISDLIMPEMGGHGFYLEFKKIPGSETVPVIILTSSNDPWDILKSMNMKVDAYVLKPYDAIQLLWEIKNLLERSTSKIMRS